jgi:hypothetical protein
MGQQRLLVEHGMLNKLDLVVLKGSGQKKATYQVAL